MIKGLIWFARALRSRDRKQRFDALMLLGKRILPGIESQDELERFAMLTQAAGWLLPKYRFKWPQIGWWDDQEFTNYLTRFDELSLPNTDRRWMLAQLMRLTSSIAGDTAECGVFHGAGSYLMCKANEQSSMERTHHAFDSFEGLSEPTPLDGSHWKKGDLAASADTVAANLTGCGRLVLHKGWIPDAFPEAADRRFSFVHIDVDLYNPTLDSLKFFYERMNDGGIILCDDYGFTSCPGATRAVDEFLQDKIEAMLSLSCGGGFLIKGRETAPRSMHY